VWTKTAYRADEPYAGVFRVKSMAQGTASTKGNDMTDRDEQTDNPIASRRALLLGAGALGAVGVLAACGTDAPTDSGSSATGNQPGGQSTTTKAPPAATSSGSGVQPGSSGIKVSDIPVGGGKIFEAERIVVTQPTAGTFKAFSAACTHQGCLVTTVESGKIGCACHGSEFRVTDGSVANGPATKALAAKKITNNAGTLTIA
jgi:nitrite reductase/ring-hydroxylating ferredoxin subunit